MRKNSLAETEIGCAKRAEPRRLRLLALCAMLLAALFGSSPARCETQEKLTVYSNDAKARESGGQIEKLLARAKEKGRIQLAVGLNLKMRTFSGLSAADAQAQKDALAKMQSAVAARVFGSAAAQADGRLWFVPFMHVSATAAEVEKLLNDPAVAVIEESRSSTFALDESVGRIRAPAVWLQGYRGNGQVVAVIDSGVDKTHPMLFGKVVSEACYSTTDATKNLQSTCPGGVASSIAKNSGKPCSFTRPNRCFHGTHVAGKRSSAAGSLNGVATATKIISIKVATWDKTIDPLNPFAIKLTIEDLDVKRALQRVLELSSTYKIAAVNLSFGDETTRYAYECDSSYPELTTAVAQLRAAGIVVVAAAGNGALKNFLVWPACLSRVIAVGATDNSDQLASYFSNYSTKVKFLAPGVDIKSADDTGDYRAINGTSQAAPHVAGAYALLRSVNPAATVDEMTAALACSGKTINWEVTTEGGAPTHLPLTGTRIDVFGAAEYLRNTTYADRSYTFESGLHLRDWTPVRGQWRIKAGAYTPFPRKSSGWYASKTSICSGKTDISATITRNRSQPADPFHKFSGLFFRAHGGYGVGGVSGYFAGFTDCPTDVSGVCSGNPLDPKGQVEVWRYRTFLGTTPEASGTARLCQKRATMVSPQGPNVLRVVSDGGNHKVYVNGSLVCDVTDLDYLTGDLLLASYMDGPFYGDTVSYDNVSIKTFPAVAGVGQIPEIIDPAAMSPARSPATVSGPAQ